MDEAIRLLADAIPALHAAAQRVAAEHERELADTLFEVAVEGEAVLALIGAVNW